jgi:GT2 family glycosyltransferase
LQLNPGNIDSLRQRQEILLAMDDLLPLHEDPGLNRETVLVGPYAGQLGPASMARSVVVVSFNSAATLEECLRRALGSLGPDDELIVVDNASTDGSREIAESVFAGDPRARLIPLEENIGYARGCNVGILATNGSVIATLNPDAFVEDCWLEKLGEHLTSGVAAVGPVSDSIAGDQFVGHYLGQRRPALSELAGILAREQAGIVRQTKLLMGVCLLMRRDVLDRHGLLYEGAELGADDLEFSWRYARLGFKLLIAPNVFVRHVGGASFSTVDNLETKKRVRRSDRALIRRLKVYYEGQPLPNSTDLWGCEIFDPALARRIAGTQDHSRILK